MAIASSRNCETLSATDPGFVLTIFERKIVSLLSPVTSTNCSRFRSTRPLTGLSWSISSVRSFPVKSATTSSLMTYLLDKHGIVYFGSVVSGFSAVACGADHDKNPSLSVVGCSEERECRTEHGEIPEKSQPLAAFVVGIGVPKVVHRRCHHRQKRRHRTGRQPREPPERCAQPAADHHPGGKRRQQLGHRHVCGVSVLDRLVHLPEVFGRL